jgi:P27 family predicted phage terminase small subunit
MPGKSTGRPRKPTAIKKLEGNPGKRPLNENEPFYPGAPGMPAWLSKNAKEEWNRIVPELDAVGLLQRVDRAMIAGYCEAWAKFKTAEKTIQEKGSTFEIPKYDRDGNVLSVYHQVTPEVSISNNAMSQIIKFCQEFGLSPSSRTRLTVEKKTNNKGGVEDLLD